MSCSGLGQSEFFGGLTQGNFHAVNRRRKSTGSLVVLETVQGLLRMRAFK
jgi:hypothetical protein